MTDTAAQVGPGPSASEQLATKVYESIGAATTCWENLEGTGVFDDARAKKIGDELLAYINDTTTVRQTEPLLGLATTDQLIRELAARSHIAKIDGQDWPSYRTVDPS